MIFGAVGLEALKVVGVYGVPRLVSKSSALYGTVGVVFALTILEPVQGWRRSNSQEPFPDRE